MKTNVLTLIITLVVGVILTGALLVPVLNDTTTTEKTFTNSGTFRMTELTEEDEVSITWAYNEPYKFNVGEQVITLPNDQTTGNPINPYTLIVSDAWGLRVGVGASDAVSINLYAAGEASSLVWSASTADSDAVTISLSNGTATFTKEGSQAVTKTYENVFIPDIDGQYVLKNPTESVYLKSDSPIYSTGRYSLTFGATGYALNLHVEGNINDGAEASVIAPTGFTVSNVAIDKSDVAGYIDLYSFNKVTFDITQDNTDITKGLNYTQVIVPYEVTAELSNHLSNAEISLIKTIPVMVIIALVITAVGAIYIGRTE